MERELGKIEMILSELQHTGNVSQSTHLYTLTHTCTNVYVHTHTHTHTHARTHTHTHTNASIEHLPCEYICAVACNAWTSGYVLPCSCDTAVDGVHHWWNSQYNLVMMNMIMHHWNHWKYLLRFSYNNCPSC